MGTEVEAVKQVLTDFRQNTIDPLVRQVQDIDSRTRTRKWAGISLPGVESDKFSFFRAFDGIKTGDWSRAGYELEVFQNTRKKAMGTGDDEAGGYLVPAQAMPDIIEMLMAEAQVIALGATVLNDLKGAPVIFPKQTDSSTIYWVGDNDSITPSDLKVGQVRLMPRKCAALVQLSNSLLAQSVPSAEAVIRGDIARRLALAIDLAALRGSGSDHEPLGIANTPGINSVTLGAGNGALFDGTLDLFEDLAYKLAEDNALHGSLGFLFHPAIRRAIRKTKIPMWSGDLGGFPLIPAMIEASMKGDSALTEALGYPFKTTTQIPINLTAGQSTTCTEVFFANWADLLIGMWGGMSILASNVAGTAFAMDQTWIRIISQVDIGLRHEESFCLCNTIKVSV